MKPVAPRSNWTVAGLISQLPRYRRVDGGDDDLAFRLGCDSSGRTAYVYLSVEEPAVIHYCLDDADSKSREWSDSEECGIVRSAADLTLVLRWWPAAPARAA